MWFKQFAFNQKEISLLTRLVEHELTTAPVTRDDIDFIDKIKLLLDLRAQLDGSMPTREPNDTKANQTQKANKKDTEG